TGGILYGLGKTPAQARLSLRVVPHRIQKLDPSRGYEPRVLHPVRRLASPKTSSAGWVWLSPRSWAATRLPISYAHAASISTDGPVRRDSSKLSASRARSSAESLRACY